MITFEVPSAELERLKRNCIKNAVEANRDMQTEVRQRALNIAGRIFDLIPPESGSPVEAKRFEIKQYMSTTLSSRVRMAKRGKRAGHLIRRGGRDRQLKRVNLIVQARRAKSGKKGLYGEAMSAASGYFQQNAQKAVGFLKSPFLPIIRTLNPMCRFKFPFAKTKNISRWPGSSGFGWAKVVNSDKSPMVILDANVTVDANEGRVQSIYNAAATRAVADENADMENHMRERAEKIRKRLGLI